MNSFKPIERIEVCTECGSDDLYGPEYDFLVYSLSDMWEVL